MLFRRLQYLLVLGTFLLLVAAVILRKPDLPPVIAAMLPQTFRVLVQKPLAVEPISPVSLAPMGSDFVTIMVQRHGRIGPITIALADVPEGVTASVQPIPAEGSATRIEFTASTMLGDTDLEAQVTVQASIGKDSASQLLHLRVPRVGRPDFAPLDRIILKPGMEEAVSVRVNRNGFEGPLAIRGLDPPSGVVVSEMQIPQGTSTADLRIAIDADAADGTFPIALSTAAYGRDIVSDLPLVIDSIPFRVRSLRVVRLLRGETVTVDVPIERNSYSGPIGLAAAGLPADVTMPEAVVPAGQKTARVELRAGLSAMPGIQPATIHARAGRLDDADTLVIRVVDQADDGDLPRDIIAADAIGRITNVGSLGSRTTASGKNLLERLYGSSPEARDTIMRGLDWLAKGQREDGSWTLPGAGDPRVSAEAVPTTVDESVAATALALLPFLAEGVTHRRSSITSEELTPYRSSVERGLQFLARSQATVQDESKGSIGRNPTGHAIATLALAEAYGLTKDDRLRPFLQSALKYLLRSQVDSDGGWRETPDGAEELATSVWDVMALRTAQYAHVAVPRKALKRAEMFTEDCGAGPADNRQSLYANTPGDQPNAMATATGLFVRQLLGWQKSEPALATGCSFLMNHLPPENADALGDNETWFFATQVLRNMEGDDFDLCNHLVQSHLVRTQERKAPVRGSWRPLEEAAALRQSRMYATVLSLLTLQVPYRHLPLYRPVRLRVEDAKDEEDQDEAPLDDTKDAGQ